MVLSSYWKIHSGGKGFAGDEISLKEFVDAGWIDAYVPSTVMGVLTENNDNESILDAENYSSFDKSVFDIGWWYRTSFILSESDLLKTVLLNFDGISYYANIWLNGKQVATSKYVFGSFKRFSFDISEYVNVGENILAVEVIRQKEGDFGLGFADWNPRPLDENMGIWRDVRIETVRRVYLKNSFIQTKVNTKTLNDASLAVSAELENFSKQPVSGIFKFNFENVGFEMPVNIDPGETVEVLADSSQFKQLHIKNPKLWWCAGLGEPNLYSAEISFEINGEIESQENIRFGIRQIDSYFNAQGHRGFRLNGKDVLIKGAGWTDDIFLRDTPHTNELQVQYVKDMGLNTIRFENIWGTSQNIYDLCDEYGLLAMVGWSCQWEWDYYLGKKCDDYGGASEKADYDLLIAYQHDQIKWLRNHPSIFCWVVGSDMLPRPELEKRYVGLFNEIDQTRPWLGAASWRESELTGPTGVKMYGPYEYVGPSYWYIDKKFGGAFGFNTETGPGTQIPVKESLERMLPPGKLWPLNPAWDKHCTASADAMNKINYFSEIVTKMWGKPKSFDDFLVKSHLVNYEAIRPMFEAFRVNRPNATGIIQWMLNSAWPSLYWQLYDYYLVPTPAYYATKKALEPIQLIYDYGKKAVYISNETPHKVDGLSAVLTVYSESSEEIISKEFELSVDGSVSKKVFDLPEFDQIVFVDLHLVDKNRKKIADNFYWLSPNQEEYDWEATYWAHTPMKQYFNYKKLNALGKAKLKARANAKKTKTNTEVTITLNNETNVISLFNQLKVHSGDQKWIIPSFYSDNYLSIAPYGEKTVHILLDGVISESLFIEVSGFNSNELKVNLSHR